MTVENKIDYDIYDILLNERQFELRPQKTISSRRLHNWRKIGLLEDNREFSGSGNVNYFSPVDLVWISIIIDLKNLQVAGEKIKNAQKGLFTPVKAGNNKMYPALQYFMTHIFETNTAVYMILNDTQELLILDDKQYFKNLKQGIIENHICIYLNKQIRDTLHDIYTYPDFKDFKGLSSKEIQVLNIIRSKAYKYIKITSSNGEMTRLEGTQRINKEKSLAKILKSGDYQDLEIKQHSGKVVWIDRTVRKKL
ncbi:hypothetical protein HN014_10540 [Aquimarina sp. TRL1]|uniref:hypothetical protein n=1 Tax=Aquimarina sp. (strain TRL1) TaxID=2736252 RepID=UPI00158BA178|nr:hypothetical protein [Aquimarina sp. TRL1]QKX05334.1 hypothetical protein HN014_10540 [Aquimarina sp. TRL1]